ncbi:MAG: alpha/beta hydrolase [Anaerolineae bacterium]|nr:alpha/beta hydrolase [Anaerolineae bacterium]
MILWLFALILLIGETPMPQIRVLTDIPYNTAEDAHPRQVLDLYLPTTENFPIVVYVHGGAWVGGDKNGYANIGNTLAQAGYGVAIINYRLSPQFTHPAHTQDGAMAVAWLVEHITEYGGDPDMLFLTGHSAGGHMVSLLTLDPQYLEAVDVDPSIIKGVISYSGLYWIDDWIMNWARNAFPDGDAERQAVSPIHLIEDTVENMDIPPYLMIASQNDYPELLVEQADMGAIFDKFEIPYTAHVIDDRDHFGLVTAIGTPDDPTTQIILDWLNDLREDD